MLPGGEAHRFSAGFGLETCETTKTSRGSGRFPVADSGSAGLPLGILGVCVALSFGVGARKHTGSQIYRSPEIVRQTLPMKQSCMFSQELVLKFNAHCTILHADATQPATGHLALPVLSLPFPVSPMSRCEDLKIRKTLRF